MKSILSFEMEARPHGDPFSSNHTPKLEKYGYYCVKLPHAELSNHSLMSRLANTEDQREGDTEREEGTARVWNSRFAIKSPTRAMEQGEMFQIST